MTPDDNPLVRAVGRLPARVHTKLLVAFVGTGLLVVVVAVLGLRLLGESNDRVVSLGGLQERAAAYGTLRSDARHVRQLLAGNVGRDYCKVLAGCPERRGPAIDAAVSDAVTLIPSSTSADILGFVPPAEDERFLRKIRATGQELSNVMGKITSRDSESLDLRSRSEHLASDLDTIAAE